MYLRVTRRKNQDTSVATYLPAGRDPLDPVKRRPAAHIIHNFGRAETLDREALLRLARSISRVAQDGLDVPAAVAAPGTAIALEWLAARGRACGPAMWRRWASGGAPPARAVPGPSGAP